MYKVLCDGDPLATRYSLVKTTLIYQYIYYAITMYFNMIANSLELNVYAAISLINVVYEDCTYVKS